MPPHSNVPGERLREEEPVDSLEETIYLGMTPPATLSLHLGIHPVSPDSTPYSVPNQYINDQLGGLLHDCSLNEEIALYETTRALLSCHGDENVPPPKRQRLNYTRPQDGEKAPAASSGSSGSPVSMDSALSSNDCYSHSSAITKDASLTSVSCPVMRHQQIDQDIEEVTYNIIG